MRPPVVGYVVKEIFHTLQGEGMNAGRAAVFCRFTACNLWTGREDDRVSAVCDFCDTDFVGTDGEGGGRFGDARSVAAACAAAWGDGRDARLVVLTGGEPALQVDDDLVRALHDEGFTIAIETNGTRPLPAGIDWICVSPKATAAVVVTEGHELKLVHPQLGVSPASFEGLNFRHFLLSPMDGPRRDEATAACIAYVKSHPRWRLSLQTHKLLGIP
jgi:7-carboxy-7-deazaguanine synthase (Cx14CxxC type)